jgi:hypothetical protein
MKITTWGVLSTYDQRRLTADIAVARHATTASGRTGARRLRYGLAILAVMLAFAARYVIYGDLQNRLVFTFLPAAMVAVCTAGWELLQPSRYDMRRFLFMQRFALWPW